MSNAAQFIEYIGPVWSKNALTGLFDVPKRTLGWHAIDWIMENVTNGEKGNASGPFLLTPEQGRFILWFYALNEDGTFLYNESQLQRLKGWGKDPLVCIIALFEAFGPCRFDGWLDDGVTPKAKQQVMPLVQIIAVSQDQTFATLRLFKHYLSDEFNREHRVEVNTETVKTWGTIVIEALANNPRALEGRVTTFCIANETQHWISDVSREMWRTLTRNSVKTKGGTTRVLSITNAYDPNLGSVAQETREQYELQLSKMGSSKILYDSVEIVPEAPLFIYDEDVVGGDVQSNLNIEETRKHIASMVEIVRGDSKWSSIERIVDEFFDVRYPPDLNKRFWLNTIVSSEDSWIDVRDYDKCVMNTAKMTDTTVRKEKIALFFDGSKNDDSTALVGCRISDGYIFKINAWHKPRKSAGAVGVNWLVPRTERDKQRYDFEGEGYVNPYRNIETVDSAVERAFNNYEVVGFFADPSHTKDDVSNQRYWDEIIEKWHVRYSSRLSVWAGSRSGAKSEGILWDMSDSNKIEEFAEFAERVADLVMRNELLISGDEDMRIHFKNAKVYRTKSGLESIWKGKRNSTHKIDLAVCAIGASLVRSKYLKQYGEQKKKYTSANRFA